MLAYVGGNESRALGNLIEFLNDQLRLDDLGFTIILEAVASTPGFDLRPPGIKGHLIRRLLAGFELLYQLDQHVGDAANKDRKSTRLNSSHPSISYAVFCL